MKKLAIILLLIFISLPLYGFRDKPRRDESWQSIGGGYIEPTEEMSITAPNLQASDSVKITGQMTPTFLYAPTSAYGANFTMSYTETYNCTIFVTGATEVEMQASGKGRSFNIINNNKAATAIGVDPNGTDLMIVNGDALSDGGDKVTMAAETEMACISSPTSTYWYCRCQGGTCTDGGA